MSYTLAFHPDVDDEVDEASRYYEEQRPGLGDEFLQALDAVFELLRQTPEMHQIVYRDARRALPRRFPYAIIYRVTGSRVEVIAVQHTRRDPGRCQARV